MNPLAALDSVTIPGLATSVPRLWDDPACCPCRDADVRCLCQFRWSWRTNVARTRTRSSCTARVRWPVRRMRPASSTTCCTARRPWTRSGRASRCTAASTTASSGSSRTLSTTSSWWRATATASARSRTWSRWRPSDLRTDHSTSRWQCDTTCFWRVHRELRLVSVCLIGLRYFLHV